MKIRMKTGLSGPKFSLAPGDTKDFADEKEAQRLIDAKFAELVSDAMIAPAPVDETTAERIARLEAELAEAQASRDAEAKATAPTAPAASDTTPPTAAPTAPPAVKPSTGKASSKVTGSQA